MIRKTIISILALLICAGAMAETVELTSFHKKVKGGYNFIAYVPPGARATDKLPVIFFLHGRSLTGSDLNMVKRYGCLNALGKGVDINAIVVAPQTPVVGWEPDKLNATLSYVLGKFRGDPSRVYFIGLSMGGWGVLNMVQTYPDKVAAAMAMCGGYAQDSIDGLLQVPLWIIHGIFDDVTPCTYSQNLVSKMMSSGKADRLLCDWPACGHGNLTSVFLLDETYRWLMSHNLADPGRKVNRRFRITDDMIRSANSKLDKSKFRPLHITEYKDQ